MPDSSFPIDTAAPPRPAVEVGSAPVADTSRGMTLFVMTVATLYFGREVLVPITLALLLAFVLAVFLKQIPLSDTAGMVARGEAIGGAEAAAHEAAVTRNATPPLVIAVTVLTSMNQAVLTETGIVIELMDQVLRLAELTKEAGLDGVVASPRETAAIRRRCGADPGRAGSEPRPPAEGLQGSGPHGRRSRGRR